MQIVVLYSILYDIQASQQLKYYKFIIFNIKIQQNLLFNIELAIDNYNQCLLVSSVAVSCDMTHVVHNVTLSMWI